MGVVLALAVLIPALLSFATQSPVLGLGLLAIAELGVILFLLFRLRGLSRRTQRLQSRLDAVRVALGSPDMAEPPTATPEEARWLADSRDLTTLSMRNADLEAARDTALALS